MLHIWHGYMKIERVSLMHISPMFIHHQNHVMPSCFDWFRHVRFIPCADHTSRMVWKLSCVKFADPCGGLIQSLSSVSRWGRVDSKFSKGRKDRRHNEFRTISDGHRYLQTPKQQWASMDSKMSQLQKQGSWHARQWQKRLNLHP